MQAFQPVFDLLRCFDDIRVHEHRVFLNEELTSEHFFVVVEVLLEVRLQLQDVII